MCWCSISTTTTTTRHCALQTLPVGNHEVLAQCRRQEAQRVEAVTCCCAARRAPAEQQQQQRPAHTAARFGLLACRPQLAPSRSRRRRRSCGFLSQRQQETAGQRKPRAEYTVTATSTNDRVNWPLKIPRWTKGTCRRGRANFQLLVDGQAGSSLLLVVRFCFGLLQPRSLAPLGNADKKVQAAWRRGDGGNELVLSRPAEGAAPFPNSSSGLHLLHLGHR